MKMGFYIFALILISCNDIQSDLNCQKFKEGVFYIPFNERVQKSYYIFRLRENQVEIDNEKNETYVTVKWIDDCTYVAYLNPESVEEKKRIDPNLVLDSTIVKFQKTKGDTLFYKATSFFENKTQDYKGKMIRLGDVPPRDKL